MTKKHKLRKSKHLLENKKDVDDNVENILRMIGEENEPAENEPSDDSENTFKKSKLSSLVKGFHEDYQYLHKHYKQLISKLENVGHSSSGSDSSDSDTEGDRSDNDDHKTKVDLSEENGWKQKLVEDRQGKEQNMEAEIEKLKQNTEEQAKEISDLKQLLDKAIKDKEATRVELSSNVASLSSENENLKLLVETTKREAGESHKTIALMENGIRTLSVEKQTIEKERDGLKISIVYLENKREDLRNQLQDTVEKCTFLSSQLEKAQLAEKELQTLLSEIEKMKNENFMLSRENDNLKAREQNLDTECSQLKATIAERKAENDTLTEEKHLLDNKLQLLGVEIDGLMVEKEELLNNVNIERGYAAEEKERLVLKHSKCLNELEKAQSSFKELESTNGALNDNIAVLQKEKNSLALQIQQLEDSFKKLGNELEQELERISVLQKNDEDLELANSNLQNELATVQGQKNEAVASTIDLGSKLEEQNQQISNLQETIENLEAAKTNMYNEVTVCQEEKNAALLQVEQLEAYLKNLESELEQKQNQFSALQQANEELVEKNSNLERQFEEARSKLQEEIIVLQEEKERALDNLQTIEEELEKQREQNSILQLANEDLHKSTANLEKQLEDSKVSSRAEILALQEQKNEALSDLQQSEISIKNLRMELEQGRDQISILHLANEDMKDNDYRLNQQLEETRTSLHAEIAAVHHDKDAIQLELEHTLDSARNLEIVLENQRENLSTLQQANDELQKNNRALTEQFEVIKIDLQEEVKMAQEEKERGLDNLQQSNTKIKTLEEELEKQRGQNSILQLANEDLHNSTANLEKQLEDTKASSHAEILALQEQKNKVFLDLQQSEISIKNLKMELEQGRDQISILHLANEDMKDNNYRLDQQLEETRTSLHAEIAALREEKNTAQLELQHSLDSARSLEIVLEKQRENLSTLQQANDDLQKNIRALTEQFEVIKIELQEEVKMAQEEKERALDNLQQSNTRIKTLEEELEKQREQNSILQLANEDMHNSTANLKKQLEDAKVSSDAEILALQEQKNEALSDLQQSEISIKNLRMELEQGKDQISVLHLANEDMKDSNYRLDQQLEETRTSLHAEIAALREEKDAAQLELQQSLASARNFEIALEKQRDNLLTLQQANDDLKKNNCTLTEQFEVIKIKLQEEVKMEQEEKETALTQLEKSEASIKNLESEMTQLKEELSIQMEINSSLNKQLEEAILKVSNLNEELKTVKAEAASQINDMNTNTKDLVKTIDLLSSQKTKVEENLKIITEACMEKMSFMKDFEDRVKQQITEQETTLACLQQSLRGILSSCQRLQYAYGEVSTRASHLEVLRRNHIEQIDKLEDKNREIVDKHRHLEEENLDANTENRKLQNHVQELEVQLQLAKQKLKVTEAVSKCKEDSYVMAVETSQTEIQYLEQKIQKFSGRISSLEETLVQIKGNAGSGVSTLADQLYELESHFNMCFSHFTARTCACSEELKLLRNKLHDHLDEQKELVKENDKLGIRLTEKEKVLSEMVRGASEAKEKMAQLEKIIDEKEEEISARVQEKREAIKQLSNAIIYHKNNSDDLIRYIRNHNRPRLPFCL